MTGNISEILHKIWSELFNKDNLNATESFFSLGGNSKFADQLFSKLESTFGKDIPISPTIAYDYPTLEKQAQYLDQLINKKHEEIPLKQNWQERIFEPIAIIGMSCRFPLQSNSPDAYWDNLIMGKNMLEEIPGNRWDVNVFYSPEHKTPGKMVMRNGGFISDHDCFDVRFFHVSPKEAELLDPSQRIALETAWHALENAAIPPDSLNGSSTGVFIGSMFHEYEVLLKKADLKQSSIAYLNLGVSEGAIAGRIAYSLGLHGPALSIDTACSSSLVALHEACLHLQNLECDLALVGGVNLMLIPETSISFSQANMLSADGSCKSFSDDANGYVRSEGCGFLVVKRLKDVNKDDNIIGIIKSSVVNQDGASSGMTVPNRLAQEALLQMALQQARLSHEDIDYIEAHGTGTPLGDPIELGAIENVYGGRNRTLYLGSVKSNMGHLEAASGIASVIKVILALQHERIPPNLHFHAINPRIYLERIPAQIVTEPLEWKRAADKVRYAAVSNYGFIGTNAHMIIEEAPVRNVYQQDGVPKELMLLISAKTESALQEQIKKYIEYLAVTHDSISDICYTSQIGRTHFTYRTAVSGNSIKEILENLKNNITSKQIEAEHYIALEPIDWIAYNQPNLGKLKKVVLPNYPFARKRVWPEFLNPQVNSQLILRHHQDVFKNSQIPRAEKLVILKNIILQAIKETLNLPSDLRVDDQTSLVEMGMDLIKSVKLKNYLQVYVDQSLPNTLGFDYPTIESILNCLSQLLDLQAKEEFSEEQTEETNTGELSAEEIDTLLKRYDS